MLLLTLEYSVLGIGCFLVHATREQGPMARIPGFFLDQLHVRCSSPFVAMFLPAKIFAYDQVAHIPGALFFDIDGIVNRATDVRNASKF